MGNNFKIEWHTEKDNKHSHYLCSGCRELTAKVFAIIGDVGGDWEYPFINLCPKCMESLQSAISPLSVLVQTGKDTLK